MSLQAWHLEMLESGQMEQLCWNTVFARTVQENGSSVADPFCRYPVLPQHTSISRTKLCQPAIQDRGVQIHSLFERGKIV